MIPMTLFSCSGLSPKREYPSPFLVRDVNFDLVHLSNEDEQFLRRDSICPVACLQRQRRQSNFQAIANRARDGFWSGSRSFFGCKLHLWRSQAVAVRERVGPDRRRNNGPPVHIYL